MMRALVMSFLGLLLVAGGYSPAGAGALYLNEFATPSMGVALRAAMGGHRTSSRGSRDGSPSRRTTLLAEWPPMAVTRVILL